MERVISYLMEPQTVLVFDIDGVLAPYEFGHHTHSVVDDGEWMELVRTGDPYGYIPPVKLIQRMIAAKGPQQVYTCSVSNEEEYPGKQRFAHRRYGIPLDHIRFVDDKSQKIEVLRQIATERGLPEERVALIEDTVKTLDAIARVSGFSTVHVSSLFAYDEVPVAQ